jgi:hypothetical protein
MPRRASKPESKPGPPTPAAFLAAAGGLASELRWPSRALEHGDEVALVAKTETDDSFDRFVWSYDIRRTMLRCLLASRLVVPVKRRAAILELCARINEGLPFGCAEYSFDDRIVVFRDSVDLDWGPLGPLVGNTTSRVLNTAARYAPAIRGVLKGAKPEAALKKVEARK